MYPEKYLVTLEVWNAIRNSIGLRHAETGGMLGSRDGRTIDRYYFDHTARTTESTYTPDTVSLNRVKAEWNEGGVQFIGFIHSHPRGHVTPSNEDRAYGREIMKALGMDTFFMPIINVSEPPSGKIKMYSYSIDRRRLHKQPIAIVKRYSRSLTINEAKRSNDHITERFDRITSLYPLDALRRKTVVCIGLGGTRAFVEELARSGVGNFVLMDGDTVSATNIATQQTFISEIGRNKAEAVRDRILDINPEANVKVIPRFLNDDLIDEEFASIVGAALSERPTDVLICGCTDSFHAQARSAALAMKYGTPYLAGQLYRGGMAAEIYFSYPGVTNKSCPRCALSSRYKAYENGYKNDVTSDGTPIFATTRVNATKGQVALMLLLYHEGDCAYSKMLDEVADRNFVMIRMSPLADSTFGIGIFQEAVRADSGLCFFDETVWIPQQPNNEKNGGTPCPMCGGNGDLVALRGKIHDTRSDW